VTHYLNKSSLASSGGTVVEHSTHNPKIKGLNHTTGNKKRENGLKEKHLLTKNKNDKKDNIAIDYLLLHVSRFFYSS
jgi:hypothetical protein